MSNAEPKADALQHLTKRVRRLLAAELIEEKGATLLRNETYYKPRNFFATLMNMVLLRRKFCKVRQKALEGIKALAEAAR